MWGLFERDVSGLRETSLCEGLCEDLCGRPVREACG